MQKEIFTEYKARLADVTDSLNLKEAISSGRHGARKFRDYFVFLRMAWTESLSYFAVIQAMIIYVALVPNAIQNINDVLSFVGLPKLPLIFASVMTFCVICIIFLFGIVAYRFFGLARSANEISCRYSPGQLLVFKELLEIKEEIRQLKEEKK